MAAPITIERNGYGNPCVIFQCGQPAIYTLRTLVLLKFFGTEHQQPITFALCESCKQTLQGAINNV